MSKEARKLNEVFEPRDGVCCVDLDSIPDILFITTEPNGIIIKANQKFLEVIGRSLGELVGRSIHDLGLIHNPSKYKESLKHVKDEQPVTDLIIQFYAKKTNVRWGRLTIKLAKFQGKRCLLNIVSDITTSKMVEDELRDSQEYSYNLLENAPNPIVVVNADTSVRYVNSATERFTCFSSAELVGSKPPYPWWDKLDYDVNRRHLHLALTQGAQRIEAPIKTKDGQLYWVEVNSKPVRKDDRLDYLISSWNDITEEKRLRENIRLYIKEITKAQEEERKRIAEELHDETVQSLANLCLEIRESIMLDKRKESIPHQITEVPEKIEKLIEDLRCFSNNNLIPGHLDKFGLVISLRSLVDDMNRVDTPVYHLEVLGTERRLESDTELALFRITQEALRNVRKHANAKESKVIVDYKTANVLLKISDNGVGFSVPRALSYFARERKLGLLVMEERAKLVGGRFKVTSQLGRGTKVFAEVEA
jgi:PAS domain S-box-containing protein